MYVYIYICVCVCVCVYIYVCMYIYVVNIYNSIIKIYIKNPKTKTNIQQHAPKFERFIR